MCLARTSAKPFDFGFHYDIEGRSTREASTEQGGRVWFLTKPDRPFSLNRARFLEKKRGCVGFFLIAKIRVASRFRRSWPDSVSAAFVRDPNECGDTKKPGVDRSTPGFEASFLPLRSDGVVREAHTLQDLA